jgi:5-hydroxyisourate hydrolase
VSGHRSRVTTHVLDATAGRPAAGVVAALERQTGAHWQEVSSGRTDADGRISDFGPEDLEPGVYRVTFATGPYFADRGQPTFYPEVVIPFRVDDPDVHYHVPLLLSPYAYSTYRGS